MTKQQIINDIGQRHKAFCSYVLTLSDADFNYSLNDTKWTAGQQLAHIQLAVAALKPIGLVPKPLIKLIFGKPKKPSLTYNQLVEKYQLVLQNGGKSTKAFSPKAIKTSQKTDLSLKIDSSLASLQKTINKFSEQELDEYLIPHPLLGKLTLREMLYFTAYHASLHHQITIQNLAQRV